ncbi:Uncharacterised protein [Mycobacterium tuberculosis]|nr:Uncharacterised protein [Mycobacterium tuberculosis]
MREPPPTSRAAQGVQEPWPSIRRIGDRFPHRGPAGSTPCPPGTRECPDGTGQGPDHRGHRNGQDHRSGCRPRHTAPLGTHRAGMPAARRRTAGDRARHRRRPVAHRYRIAPAHRARGRFTADGGGGRGSPRAPPGTTSPDDGARTGPATNLARSTSGCRAPARLHRGTAVPHSCGFRQGTGSRASGQGGPHRAAAPPRRTHSGHPAHDVANPRARGQRCSCCTWDFGNGCPRIGRSCARQRTDRVVTHRGVSAVSP